jgi:hypothetical protein
VDVHARLRGLPAHGGIRGEVLRVRGRVPAGLDVARDRRRDRHPRQPLLLPRRRPRDVHAADGGPAARAHRRLATK